MNNFFNYGKLRILFILQVKNIHLNGYRRIQKTVVFRIPHIIYIVIIHFYLKVDLLHLPSELKLQHSVYILF